MIDILLVEDNPADIRLMVEIIKESEIPNSFHVATDGEEAIEFLRKQRGFERSPRPDIIILDLNLPKMDGREVLREIKADPELKRIPVVVMTTSADEDDITAAYDYHASCYLTKPVDLKEFDDVVQTFKTFWLSMVKLPK